MDGWIYCFSNEYMPGIVKIGRTEEQPEKRLKDANSCTWNLPFKLIISKKVNNYKEKEICLHKVFDKYRIHPKREFFRISHQDVIDQFNLMDGIQILGGSEKTEKKIKKKFNKIKTNNIQPQDTTSNTSQPNTTPNNTHLEPNNEQSNQTTNNMNLYETNNRNIKNRNHLTKLTDGQRIKHNNKLDSVWYGIYNSKNNSIICSVDLKCTEYKGNSPLNRFVADHYAKTRPERTSANAWAECEYEISENNWISINNLRED